MRGSRERPPAGSSSLLGAVHLRGEAVTCGRGANSRLACRKSRPLSPVIHHRQAWRELPISATRAVGDELGAGHPPRPLLGNGEPLVRLTYSTQVSVRKLATGRRTRHARIVAPRLDADSGASRLRVFQPRRSFAPNTIRNTKATRAGMRTHSSSSRRFDRMAPRALRSCSSPALTFLRSARLAMVQCPAPWEAPWAGRPLLAEA